MRRAVFLDRDGVLLRTHVRGGKSYAARTVAEVEILPGVAKACAALSRAGFLLVMITNQPDVKRGFVTREFVEDQVGWLVSSLGLDGAEICWHDDGDDCGCRKPKPGLLLQAAEKWDIDLAASAMVGDRWRDVEAGRAAGCRTVLVWQGYDEGVKSSPDFTCGSLLEAVPWLLETLGRESRV